MRLSAKNIEVDVQPARPSDVPLLLAFIRSMAAFERLTVSATEESLRAALFGEPPAAHALVASVAGEPVGYATYYFTFATMTGRRGLWLDDLYVDAAYRGRGIGGAFLRYLAAIAADHGCARFEWMVLDWNETAKGFYERAGATKLDEWRIYRLEGPALTEAAIKGPA